MLTQVITDKFPRILLPRMGRPALKIACSRPSQAGRGWHLFGSAPLWFGQAMRFGLVGLSGLIVALAVINSVMVVVRAFVLANAMAFFIAVSWNFLLNRWLTFPGTRRPIFSQWLAFLLGALGGALLNWAVAGTLYYQVAFFHTHYNAAALIGTVVAGGANFLWARLHVFRSIPIFP